jgi:hypothetical protein
MKYIVIKEYRSDYPDPIKLTKDDLVLVNGQENEGSQ